MKKRIIELSSEHFACLPNAVASAEKFIRSIKWHRPTVSTDLHDEKSNKPDYQLLSRIEHEAGKFRPDNNACGQYILATYDTHLTAEEMLIPHDMRIQYKEQNCIE